MASALKGALASDEKGRRIRRLFFLSRGNVNLSALAGHKVLDMSRLLPGPFATLLCTELGATVDKLEEPGQGDYLRTMPPLVGDTSAYFLLLNRGKRSLELDLKTDAGCASFRELLRDYDVLVEQFRPGVMDRLGLSIPDLLKENPRLIVCSITGYGPADIAAGHDLNYIARAGLLATQGPENAAPTVPGFQVADVGGALFAVIAILAALLEREKTGAGKHVEVSLVDSARPFGILGFASALYGKPEARGNQLLSGGIAPYGIYETKDGVYFALAALEPKFFRTFCDATGVTWSKEAHVPGAHQQAWREKLEVLFRSRTAKEWVAFGSAHDVCLERIVEVNETPNACFEVESHWGRIGQVRTPLTPLPCVDNSPPRLGEHTEAIISEARAARH